MPDNDTCSVQINLYDADTSKPLIWVSSPGDEPKTRKQKDGDPDPPPPPIAGKSLLVDSVTYRTLGCCGDPDPCSNPVQASPNKNVSFLATISRNTDARINVEAISAGKITRTGTLFLPGSCDAPQPQNLFMSTAPDQSAKDKVNVAVEAYRCPGEEGQGRSQVVKIKEAWATVLSPATETKGDVPGKPAKPQKEPPIAATVTNGVAFFELRPGVPACIDATFEDDRMHAIDPMPLQFTPGIAGGLVKLACREAQRWLALLFFNANGEPQSPEIVVEGNGIYPSPQVNQQGVCVIKPAKVGAMRVSSSNFEISPGDFYVSEYPMAQVKLFEVKRKRQELWDSEAEIILDFAHAVAAQDNAMVRVLTLEGKLLDILRLESGKTISYSAPVNEPIVFEGVVNGVTVDKIVHRPKELAANAEKV